MIKRLKIALGVIMTLATLTLTGCMPNGDDDHEMIVGSEVVDTLRFSSVEELLSMHRSVRMGRMVGHHDEIAESVNFSSLETLYLPTGIPESYHLFRILVNENFVTFCYLPEEHLVSEEATRLAIAQSKDFQFSFTRWDLDSPMDGIFRQVRSTEESLIDDSFLFIEPNMLIWASDREVLHLYTPLPSRSARGWSAMGEFAGVAANEPADLAVFTEVAAINLHDDHMIAAMFGEIAFYGEEIHAADYEVHADDSSDQEGVFDSDVRIETLP